MEKNYTVRIKIKKDAFGTNYITEMPVRAFTSENAENIVKNFFRYSANGTKITIVSVTED